MRWVSLLFTVIEVTERAIRIVHVAAELVSEITQAIRQEDDETSDFTEEV